MLETTSNRVPVAAPPVLPGARVVVALPESGGSTGYRWRRPLFDARVVSLESDQFHPREGGAVGAAGERRFVFVAKMPGETVVQSVKKRPWEPEEQAVEAFEMWIEVCAGTG
jgi:predicted secreted protein